MGTKRNDSLVKYYGLKTFTRFSDNDQDTDSDSNNECYSNSNSSSNWPGFLVVKSSSDDLALNKLSPFAVQKGFQGIAGTPKSIRRLRHGSFPSECARKPQATGLLKTTRFVDRPVRVVVHKTLHSSREAICCRELFGMSEVEIKKELQEQGIVEVLRVTVKRNTEKAPNNTLSLTFNTLKMPKEIAVGYLNMKVALFIPNPVRCFNCNRFGHTSQRCKVAAKCQWYGTEA